MILPTNPNQPAIIEALEAAIDFLAAYRRAIKEMPEQLTVEPICPSTIGRVATAMRAKQINPEIVESIKLARIVIVQARRPLALDEIYKRCRERGLHITGKDPKGALSARLKRHGKIENLIFKHGFGWWTAELPIPR